MSVEEIRAKRDALRERLAEPETTALAPSRVASQFYCEKQLALARKHGDRETPEKARGGRTHRQAAATAEAITDAEFWAALDRGDRQVLVESPLVGEAAEFPVRGIPDAIVFEHQAPQLLFERKTTGRPTTLYDSQHIQAWLYGFMLDSLGFETRELKIAVLSHERVLNAEAERNLQRIVVARGEDWAPGEYELTASPQAVLHLRAFSKLDYLEALDWALGYWREKRAPTPTTAAGKCRACEYSDVCSDAKS
jgi:hypothetical protein